MPGVLRGVAGPWAVRLASLLCAGRLQGAQVPLGVQPVLPLLVEDDQQALPHRVAAGGRPAGPLHRFGATMSGTVPRGATTTGNYYPGGQCTWYAEQEAAQYTGLWLKSFGNAMYRAGNAAASRWAVGVAPRIGSVIVFQPGVDGAGVVGHVAFVTNYYPNTGRVVISEMNFTGPGQVDTRTITNGINNPGIRYIYLNP